MLAMNMMKQHCTRLVFGLCALLLLLSCVDMPVEVCANGVYCPSGQVCLDSACVPKDQVIACEGRGVGSPCDAAEFSGYCLDSLCVKAECGNGYVEVTDDYEELCDDGNLVPGDGCSGDCQMQCGDGILDPEREVCDTLPPHRQTCLTRGYDMGALGCDISCERADTSRCISFSWRPVGTMRADWHMGAVWAFSSQDIYAVGGVGELSPDNLGCFGCGVVFHYDGTSGQGWQTLEPDPGQTLPLTSIWAAGPGDIFAAGVGNQMWHYDGSVWTPVNTGLSNPFVIFWDVWGTSADNLFALYREYNLPDNLPHPGIIHYDGTTWKTMNVPTTGKHNGIWGRSADDVYLGGDGGVFHYDGNTEQQWTRLAVAPGWEIMGVWGNSREVVAVGTNGRIVRQSPDTGGRWMEMASRVTSHLYRVWGSDESDFFAAGKDGTIVRKSADTDEWSTMSPGVDSHLTDLFGLGPADVFAVGADGTALHCCGWEQLEESRDSEHLSTLAAVGDECVYAAGASGVIIRHDVNQGAGFETMESGVSVNLQDIWGTDCDQGTIVVGDDGTILRHDGTRWSAMDSGVDSALYGVWGSRADNVFAVGDEGMVVHWNGAEWRVLDVPPAVASLELVDVWGVDDNVVFMVSDGPTLVRYEHDPLTGMGDWLTMPYLQGLADVSAIWGSSACDVWAAGNELMHYQCDETGSPGNWLPWNWSRDALLDLCTIWGTAWNDVFMGGNDGALMHFDGTAWLPMRSPTNQTVNKLTGTDDGRFVYVLAANNRVYRLSREEAR